LSRQITSADQRQLASRRVLRATLAVLMLGAAVNAALAQTTPLPQTVPLPKPAPKARGAAVPSDGAPSSTSTASPTYAGTPPAAVAPPVVRPQPQAAPPQQQQGSFLPDPRKLLGFGGPTVSFDANQRALAAKMSTYLSSISTLSGNFVQVGPNGAKVTGDFIIQKPGKVRFQYDAPSPLDIISDGTTMAIRDHKLATQDIYPLSQTPLRYLLSDRIDLLADTNVVNVSADDTFATVTIEEKQALIGTNRLTLMFGAKDMQLKQWTITDPQGYDTTIAIYNLSTAKKADPDMFKIDFTQYNTNEQPR
jgi:outer membrane lipoprotein-sorting protein